MKEKWLLHGDEPLTFGDAFHVLEEVELLQSRGRYAQGRASDLLALDALSPFDRRTYWPAEGDVAPSSS